MPGPRPECLELQGADPAESTLPSGPSTVAPLQPLRLRDTAVFLLEAVGRQTCAGPPSLGAATGHGGWRGASLALLLHVGKGAGEEHGRPL